MNIPVLPGDPRATAHPRPGTYQITNMTVAGVADLFYTGTPEIPAIAGNIDRFLNSGDTDRNGRANGSDTNDDGTLAWLDANLREVHDGVRAHVERFVRAYDSDSNGEINGTEMEELKAGVRRIRELFLDFGNGDAYYVLTAAKMSTPERRATTERVIEAFGEMLDHGLPDSIQATPPTRHR